MAAQGPDQRIDGAENGDAIESSNGLMSMTRRWEEFGAGIPIDIAAFQPSLFVEQARGLRMTGRWWAWETRRQPPVGPYEDGNPDCLAYKYKPGIPLLPGLLCPSSSHLAIDI